MDTEVKLVPDECGECGVPGKTYPTPFGKHLCTECWQEWFDSEEEKPVTWVVQCKCGDVVKGVGAEQACGCGRQYAMFQLY